MLLGTLLRQQYVGGIARSRLTWSYQCELERDVVKGEDGWIPMDAENELDNVEKERIVGALD